ncbi:MAG TPA: hypothetical protein PK498_05075 [Candidatus Kapabacteria bacterium]|nr:hypothetical protein [Candidatus Kapabacteria bacterium]
MKNNPVLFRPIPSHPDLSKNSYYLIRCLAQTGMSMLPMIKIKPSEGFKPSEG